MAYGMQITGKTVDLMIEDKPSFQSEAYATNVKYQFSGGRAGSRRKRRRPPVARIAPLLEPSIPRILHRNEPGRLLVPQQHDPPGERLVGGQSSDSAGDLLK